jgi:hypothetical protein
VQSYRISRRGWEKVERKTGPQKCNLRQLTSASFLYARTISAAVALICGLSWSVIFHVTANCKYVRSFCFFSDPVRDDRTLVVSVSPSWSDNVGKVQKMQSPLDKPRLGTWVARGRWLAGIHEDSPERERTVDVLLQWGFDVDKTGSSRRGRARGGGRSLGGGAWGEEPRP